VLEHIAALAAERADGRGGWRRELAEDPNRLAEDVRALLSGIDMLRIRVASDDVRIWWFSPATGRWAPPPVQPRTKSMVEEQVTLEFEFDVRRS